jgi:hypothetical protein
VSEDYFVVRPESITAETINIQAGPTYEGSNLQAIAEGLETRYGLPVVFSEHIPKGQAFVFSRPPLPGPQRTAVVKMTSPIDVERWMAISPREHARRIVAGVLEERECRERLRRDLAALRASMLFTVP